MLYSAGGPQESELSWDIWNSRVPLSPWSFIPDSFKVWQYSKRVKAEGGKDLKLRLISHTTLFLPYFVSQCELHRFKG